MSEDFYTVDEVAEKLRLDITTIRKYIRQKKLPAYRFGREYRIKRQDYEKFVEERRSK